MSTTPSPVSTQRPPELLDQTVVVIGGSAGIGLETARRARLEGADVVLAARNPERLERAALELEASSTAAFDATDPSALQRFFEDLPGPLDHVMVTGPGPRYGSACSSGMDEVRLALTDHVVLPLEVARNAAPKMRPGGSLIFMGGTGGRKISRELGIVSAATSVLTSVHGGARAGARPGSRQPHRRRLRRHSAGGVVLRRRRTRSAARGASHEAPDTARRRPS